MGEEAWKENRTNVARINRYKRYARKDFEKKGESYTEEQVTEIATKRNEDFIVNKSMKDYVNE